MISEKANKIADGCRFCWMCRHICPTGIATGREEFTPRARGLMVSMLNRGEALDADIAEAFFSCALCGSCSNDCVTGFEPPVFIREARREAVVEDKLPPAVAKVVERALEGGDVVEKTADNSALIEKIASLPKTAEVAVALGETAMNRQCDLALHFMSVLEKAGVNFTVVCEKTGGELFDLVGDVEEVCAQADAFVKAANETGAKTIVALDATDARTLIMQYPDWEMKLAAQPVTAAAFVDGLVKGGKLKLETRDLGVVTYQDPDHIVRDLDQTQPARDLLAAMGIPVHEMFLHGRLARSCGNEVLASYYPHITDEMARIRLDDAVRCGADTLVTSCPVDFDMTSGKNDKIRVVDLFTLIDGAC